MRSHTMRPRRGRASRRGVDATRELSGGLLEADRARELCRGSDPSAGGAAPNSTSGTSTAHIRLEALLVDHDVVRREIPRGREPERAAVGQLHELLCRRAAERVFADERRRGRCRRAPPQTPPPRPTCPLSTSSMTGTSMPPSPGLPRSASCPCATRAWRAALADEQPRGRDAVVERAFGACRAGRSARWSAPSLRAAANCSRSAAPRCALEKTGTRTSPTPGCTMRLRHRRRRRGFAHELHRVRFGGVAAQDR